VRDATTAHEFQLTHHKFSPTAHGQETFVELSAPLFLWLRMTVDCTGRVNQLLDEVEASTAYTEGENLTGWRFTTDH
jgi:hypothetical protein